MTDEAKAQAPEGWDPALLKATKNGEFQIVWDGEKYAARCEERRPRSIGEYAARCILPSGHEEPHRA